MKNGKYILVVAPEAYFMKKYRGKYCYEHHLVWHAKYGAIPVGHIIHHKNGDKHDNRVENLELLSRDDHSARHGEEKRRLASLIHGTYSSYKRRKCRCEACLRWWVKYRDKLNVWRRMNRKK